MKVLLDPYFQTKLLVPLFQTLPDEDLNLIAEISRSKNLKCKDILFFENDPAKGFYILVSGRIKIYKTSSAGREQILHFVEKGESFAEAAILEGDTYPATAEAITDSQIIFIPRDKFLQLIRENIEISFRMLGSLARRLKMMTGLVESLSLKDVESRLVSYMIEYCHNNNQPFEDGTVIRLNISKNLLAARIGTIPETLSRSLGKLQRDGYIKVSGKTITILKNNALKEL